MGIFSYTVDNKHFHTDTTTRKISNTQVEFLIYLVLNAFYQKSFDEHSPYLERNSHKRHTYCSKNLSRCCYVMMIILCRVWNFVELFEEDGPQPNSTQFGVSGIW